MELFEQVLMVLATLIIGWPVWLLLAAVAMFLIAAPVIAFLQWLEWGEAAWSWILSAWAECKTGFKEGMARQQGHNRGTLPDKGL
jgi:hypothetical protein